MKTISVWVLLLLVLGAPASAEKFNKSRLTTDRTEGLADHRRLKLTTGKQKIVDLKFNANAGANGISIGNPGVVTTTLVKVGGSQQIVFSPLKDGETTVTVRDAKGSVKLIFDVFVTGTDLKEVADQLKLFLQDIEGIQVRTSGDKVVIDGEVLIPKDFGRLTAVISEKPFSDRVINLAEVSPISLQRLSKRIQQDVNTFAPNVKTRVVNSVIWLEGTVDNFDQAKRASRVAELYLPPFRPPSQLEKDPNVKSLKRGLIQNFIVINPPPPKKADRLVRVTIHVVELSKDYKKVFGFKWQPGFTADPQITIGTTEAGAAGAAGAASFTGTISSLFPKLQSAQDAGFARVLKTGTVIVRSGLPAKLDRRTVIPYAVQGANGQIGTATANVGFNIAVTPQILGQSEDIELDLDIRQNNLVGRAGATDVPITSENVIKTKLYVKSNESAAIGGLVASDIQTNFNKDDPNQGGFGGNTSPLFTLLRSKSYNKKKSQLVVFATPQIVNNASEGTDDLKRNFRVKVD